MKEIFSNSRLQYLLFFFLICGGLIFAQSIQDMIDSNKTPINYNISSIKEIKKGDIIEGDIHSTLGSYETITTKRNGRTESTKFRYVIPIGDKKFIGFEASKDDMINSMENLTDETFDYLSQKSDTPETVIHFKGKVQKMNKEDLGYFKDYLKQGGFSEEDIENNAYNLYIQNRTFGNYIPSMIIGAIFFIIGIVILIKALNKAKEQKYTTTTNENNISQF